MQLYLQFYLFSTYAVYALFTRRKVSTRFFSFVFCAYLYCSFTYQHG